MSENHRNRLIVPNADQAEVLDAEMLEYQSGPKCGQCTRWHKSPTLRGIDGAVDMSQPTTGECRLELKSIPVMGKNPQGQPVLLGFMSGYPNNIPPDFPCCGSFTAKKPETSPIAQ